MGNGVKRTLSHGTRGKTRTIELFWLSIILFILIPCLFSQLVEIITVPNPAGQDISSAWADKNGKEAMDKCEKFTPTLTKQKSDVANGVDGLANVNINGRIMILPAIWDPVVSQAVDHSLSQS